MKQLSGTASESVHAPPEHCYEMLAAIERYPDWYPERVRSVEVLERDQAGAAVRVRARLQVAVGPATLSPELTLTVAGDPPSRVTLTRLAHETEDPERFEVVWTIDPGQLRVALGAQLDVPRLLPVAGLGDSIARGFAQAAARALG